MTVTEYCVHWDLQRGYEEDKCISVEEDNGKILSIHYDYRWNYVLIGETCQGTMILFQLHGWLEVARRNNLPEHPIRSIHQVAEETPVILTVVDEALAKFKEFFGANPPRQWGPYVIIRSDREMDRSEALRAEA